MVVTQIDPNSEAVNEREPGTFPNDAARLAYEALRDQCRAAATAAR